MYNKLVSKSRDSTSKLYKSDRTPFLIQIRLHRVQSDLYKKHHIIIFAVFCLFILFSRVSAPWLTHISLASFLWDIGNSADPDQTPQNALLDKGLSCLLTEFSLEH